MLGSQGFSNTLESDPLWEWGSVGGTKPKAGALSHAVKGKEDGIRRAAPGAVRPALPLPLRVGPCLHMAPLFPLPLAWRVRLGGQCRSMLGGQRFWSRNEPRLGEAGTGGPVERRAPPASCRSRDLRLAAKWNGECPEVK